MRRFLFGSFLLTCFACLLTAQDSENEFTIQRLLQRYTESYGGLRDTNRLSSTSVEGVQIQRGVKYQFHVRKKRPNSIRYQLDKGETTLISIYNGEQGWLQIKRGSESSTEELSGARLDMLKKEARFESPLYRHLEKSENRISLEARELIGGVYAYVLRVEEPGMQPGLYFLHPDEPHLLRIDRLDDQGAVVFQTLYRDYKLVSGYPMAHEVENRANGETISLSRLESISVNPGLLSFYFENPEK